MTSRNEIPVFVFPDSLHFFGSQRTKTLSLYNPYDFCVKFQILATNPNAFALSSSSGTVRSRHALDVVVRLRDSQLIRATLLIKLLEQSGERSGERQINVIQSEEEEEEKEEIERHKFVACLQSSSSSLKASESRQLNSNSSQSLTLALAAICCFLVLLVPHEGDHWLRVGITHKLVVSYILGLITFLFLKN